MQSPLKRIKTYLPSRKQATTTNATDKQIFVINQLEKQVLNSNEKKLGKSEINLSDYRDKMSGSQMKLIKHAEQNKDRFQEVFIKPKQEIISTLKLKDIGVPRHFQEKQEKVPNLHFWEDKMKEQSELLNTSLELQDNFQKSLFQPYQETKESKIIKILDTLLEIEPPLVPNASIASPLTPGNGWAPSIPIQLNMKDRTSLNISNLIVRVKAGVQAGDIQKEAHLSYYLGIVYQLQNNYKLAIKH